MKIVKEAVEIGNGAAVYVPKEYRGMKVVVIIPERTEDIKKRVLSKLIDFMPNILGVYLYGSYARREEKEDSDVDILIITKDKDKKIKSLFGDIDVRVLSLEEIKKSIKNFPVLILPLLKESKVFLNPTLLEELKNSKFNVKKFKWHFWETKSMLKIIKSFIELDDEEKEVAGSHVYSLIMRIRIGLMMESLLINKKFSNKEVEKLLLNYGLDEKKFKKFYSLYARVRNDEEVEEKIDKEEILELFEILVKYYEKLEKEVEKYGKKKKKIRKRN